MEQSNVSCSRLPLFSQKKEEARNLFIQYHEQSKSVNTLELHALKRQDYSLKNEEEIDNYLDNYLAKHGLKVKNIKEREYHFHKTR